MDLQIDARLTACLDSNLRDSVRNRNVEIVKEFLVAYKKAIMMYAADIILHNISKKQSLDDHDFTIVKQSFYNDTMRIRLQESGFSITSNNYFAIEKWMMNNKNSADVSNMWIDAVDDFLHLLNGSINRVTKEKHLFVSNSEVLGYINVRSVVVHPPHDV